MSNASSGIALDQRSVVSGYAPGAQPTRSVPPSGKKPPSWTVFS